MSVRRATLLAAVGASLFAPAIAAAQDPGVRYDPDSPAGKEYAIPLDAARSTGQPAARPGSAPQRFGAGIEPEDPQDATVPQSGSAAASPTPKPRARRPAGTPTASRTGSAPVPPRSDSAAQELTRSVERSGDSPFQAAGISAVIVLLIAFGAGMAGRRARRQPER